MTLPKLLRRRTRNQPPIPQQRIRDPYAEALQLGAHYIAQRRNADNTEERRAR